MYQTVYEIGALPSYGFWHCLFFVLIGTGALLVGRHVRKRRGFYLVWGIGAVVLGAVGVVISSSQHLRAYGAYRNHRVEVLEGTVEVLRRQPADGHAGGDIAGPPDFIATPRRLDSGERLPLTGGLLIVGEGPPHVGIYVL